ncbi:competence protein CoiA family protein [Nesterenkonia sp. LB17]|uniref:competence protein CoiA family protein n=1 Tax=Nesterenkonia sp. LB17 TaxID=2901230 RepID=UPI00351D29A9
MWQSTYRAPGPARPRCRDCDGVMLAKVSRNGLRFFAHLRRPESCTMEGESPAHRGLKHRIALMIRDEGFEATVEATPGVNDAGGWRADVLGTASSGRRVAFEIQLAGMTITEGQERTDRYARDQIMTIWVSTKHAVWISALPSARLKLEPETITADRGLARLNDRTPYFWTPAGEVDFSRVVRGLFNGSITTVSHWSFEERVGQRDYFTVDAQLLVSVADLARWEVVLEERRREQETHRREQEAHSRNLQALFERQRRGLRIGLQDARSAGYSPRDLRYGYEKDQWDGTPIVSPDKLSRDIAVAMGVPIWIDDRSGQRLWAVVCPVASRIDDRMARQWRIDGVRVYAESAREVARLTGPLEWLPHQIRQFAH